MTTQTKRTVRSGRATKTPTTVVYRGIKIAPIAGKRSPLARALRDALKKEKDPAGAESAHR